MTGFVLRVIFSLVVVLALMWGLARLARSPLARRGALGGMTVVARQQLTRNATLMVVKLGERGLVLGVTDQQVRLLGETDPSELEIVAEPVRRRSMPLPRGNADRTGAGTAEFSAADTGPLAGSLLSRRTWAQLVEFLRERTARNP